MDNFAHYTCSSNSLKGQCHEMNNFFEDLKNQVSFCICADACKFFCILIVKKTFFKFLLASMKTLTNSGDFPEGASEFPTPRHLKENWNFNSAYEKADSQ